MAVEPHDGSSLPDVLVENNPLSDDPVAQGDDHLRLLKIVVKNFWTQYLAAGASFDSRLDDLEAFAASGDAATLGGQNALFYQNSSNQAFGTLPAARLSGTYGINISGNAATATLATDATHAADADEALHAADSDKLGGQTLAQIEARFAQTLEYSTVSTTTIPGPGTYTVHTLSLPAATVTKTLAYIQTSARLAVTAGYSDEVSCSAALNVYAMPSNTLLALVGSVADSGGGGWLDSASVDAIVSGNSLVVLPAGTSGLRFSATYVIYGGGLVSGSYGLLNAFARVGI